MKILRYLMTMAMLLGWAVWPRAAHAATWTGSNGTDWFDAGNWDPAGVPGEAAVVSVPVGATILLTNETAALASFTMAGGTLTFSNWTTRLRATDVMVTNGATLTLPPAFTEAQMSNRVWIVCQDFTLADGALIDADGRGYVRQNGEGAGAGARAGGGHGGYGSPGGGDHPNYTRLTYRGLPYGDSATPLAPGSGAGHSTAGGAGGGAIRVQSSGDVTIVGIISANGQNGTAFTGGGGSGGSILISCDTVQGSGNGLLSACGGSYYGTVHGAPGPGGGGRIALIYDLEKQSVSSNPPVRFTAKPGEGFRDYLAETGTLYLPDQRFLSENMTAAAWDGVSIVIPGFSEWTPSSLILGGRIGFEGVEDIRVGGNMTLLEGAQFTLSGTPTNKTFSGAGMVLTVQGGLTVGTNAILELVSNHTNGISPYVECGSLNLQTDGNILAEYRGHDPDFGEGAGGFRGGGGYGGAGSEGRLNVGYTGGSPYGVRFAPVFAGSGSGSTFNARGGGLVRISARGWMRLDGTVSANGMRRLENGYGGASGGGILLTAVRFTGSGQLAATGGDANNTGGAGGGGRIALWTPFLSYAQINEMADQDDPPSAAETAIPSDTPGFDGTVFASWSGFSGSLSVAPGTGGENPELAEPGTVFFGRLIFGTLLMIQ